MEVEEYPDDYDEREEDLAEERIEKEQELIEDISPTPKETNDLFSLFWKVLKIKDSSKVGNLDKPELGMLNISVRDCQRIALLGETFNHQGFADFFWDQAQIILRTSSSKKGWFTELFVSQRKVKSRERQNLLDGTQPPKKKKKWF